MNPKEIIASFGSGPAPSECCGRDLHVKKVLEIQRNAPEAQIIGLNIITNGQVAAGGPWWPHRGSVTPQWLPCMITVFEITKGVTVAEFQPYGKSFAPCVIQACDPLVPEQRVGQYFVG